MQRIAGMTVTARGNGSFEAVFNGQRDRVVEAAMAEMARQKEALNAEMDSMREQLTGEIAVERDRADIQYRARCCLLGERLDALKASLMRRRGPVRRAMRAIENSWAMIWATAKCLPEIGERLGLWEIIREEDNRENYKRTAFAAGRRRAQEC